MLPSGESLYITRSTADAMTPNAPTIGLEESITALQDEAGGILELHLVRRCEYGSLVAAAVNGIEAAQRLLTAVNSTLRRIKDAPVDAPLQCACCPHSLADGEFTVAVVTSFSDAPQDGVSFCICTSCGETLPDITFRALAAMKAIWPECRPFRVAPGRGEVH